MDDFIKLVKWRDSNLLDSSTYDKVTAAIQKYVELTHKYRKYINNGIYHIGLGFITRTIVAHLIVFNLTLVSFGSGGGFLEDEIEHDMQSYRKRKWVDAVDCQGSLIWLPGIGLGPIPVDFPPNLPFKTTARTMIEYVQRFPHNVGNCALMLNWCYQDGSGDYDSILIMEPTLIIAIYDYGTDKPISGGEKFHSWTRTQKKYTQIYKFEVTNPDVIGDVFCFAIWRKNGHKTINSN